jgi:hydroxyacylglutathione hydrolase
VALTGPRREQQQHPRAAFAAQRVPLTRVEPDHRPGSAGLHLLAGGHLDLAVDHGDPRVLLDLVLAERLARLQDDEDGARARVGVEDDGIARPVRRLELQQIPTLHACGVSRPGYTQTLGMPLAVDSFVMGPFRSNCYVVRSERGAAEAAVIDPGDDPAPLRLELARIGTRTGGILVTHSDVDHIGGVAALAEGTGAEVWAPAAEVDALRAGETRGGMRVAPHDPAHTVTGGDEIVVAGIPFEVIDVPGHSAGHIAFHHEGELFAGDLLFAGSVGRVDLAGGDWETLLASVRALLDRLPPETIVYPGHGPATTLGRELASNPFLHELRAERQSQP